MNTSPQPISEVIVAINLVRLNAGRLPLPDNSVDMVFTDPPYVKAQIGAYELVANESARVLKPGKFLALMCGGMALDQIMAWCDASGLSFYWLYQIQMVGIGAGIVWKHGNRNKPIATRLKHILVYSKGKALARTATVSPYTAGGADKRWHFWGQDVDSHRYYIDCFSWPGDLVLDPMAGGGTTGVACAILKRRCILGDLDKGALSTMVDRFNGGHEALSPLPLFESIPI